MLRSFLLPLLWPFLAWGRRLRRVRAVERGRLAAGLCRWCGEVAPEIECDDCFADKAW